MGQSFTGHLPYEDENSERVNNAEHIQTGTFGAKRVVLYDSSGNEVIGSPDFQILMDDVTTTSMTYVGYAPIGTATSAAAWKIKRIDESGTPNTTVVKFATAGASTCIYDNRASLTYT